MHVNELLFMVLHESQYIYSCFSVFYGLVYCFISFRNDILHEDPSPTKERKFIVYESAIRSLLAICTVCSLPCTVMLESVKGSMVTLQATCSGGHIKRWTSQPMLGTMPRGNLDMAAAILCSGSSAAKAINMLKHLNIFTITARTFIRIQKSYLIPAICQVQY